MMYKVLKPIRIRTPHGEGKLQPGEVIKLSSQKAQDLLKKEKVKPYCYWLEDIREDCNPPCFEGKEMTVIRECIHFKAYWNKRFEVLKC